MFTEVIVRMRNGVPDRGNVGVTTSSRSSEQLSSVGRQTPGDVQSFALENVYVTVLKHTVLLFTMMEVHP